ncbi:MAG: hypothetical protein KDM91_00695 [Verrucomicrobiae bacterium]|nr:hypothetical protein [Verrucomicrobiae bacterium]MCP5549659.1 hypothetical protein [Akkermansiaceae bacterium]
MKLPNADRAIIERGKLRDYCLNPNHPRGKHKAKVFRRILGFGPEDAENLGGQIAARLPDEDCEIGEEDGFGKRFMVDVEIIGKQKSAVVRTGWIVKKGESIPRLTTCYVRT